MSDINHRECYVSLSMFDPTPAPDWSCAAHGSRYSRASDSCRTKQVLYEVDRERAKQFSEYGTNEGLQDGTGGAWLSPLYAKGAVEIEAELRSDYETFQQTTGNPTWMHLVREEVAEAFAETAPARLRAELLQVAALCVSWIEKIDTRTDEESRRH